MEPVNLFLCQYCKKKSFSTKWGRGSHGQTCKLEQIIVKLHEELDNLKTSLKDSKTSATMRDEIRDYERMT